MRVNDKKIREKKTKLDKKPEKVEKKKERGQKCGGAYSVSGRGTEERGERKGGRLRKERGWRYIQEGYYRTTCCHLLL